MPDEVVIRQTEDNTAYECKYGRIGNGRSLDDDLVLISLFVVRSCSTATQRICPFARRTLKDGTGWVTREGMFVLNGRDRQIVYELFPAVWWDGARHMSIEPVYLGVKRSDRDLRSA